MSDSDLEEEEEEEDAESPIEPPPPESEEELAKNKLPQKRSRWGDATVSQILENSVH
jgi:hypothetical protein